MNYTKIPTNQNLTLFQDLYQATMGQAYWKSGKAEEQAVFHLYFRKNPFNGGYTVACGLEYVIDYIENFKFEHEDLVYISEIKGNDGNPIFEKGYIDYLRRLKLEIDIDAVREGTVVFPHEPLLRVEGPILHCQLLETALLNIVNFQTLIATKAARVCYAAHGDTVLEFGARRAQGIDGSLAASRAAYIGGCDATSNVLAGKLFGIPVKGTHAHSWVMSFNNELEAFQEYANAMPNNATFLVDTYDTIQGVKNVIKTWEGFKDKYKLQGIRLDSGDLAALSIEARKLLDEAGYTDTKIVASNDLDEELIETLRQQGARIDVWGVGTQLVTGGTQSALGGVYKLAAIDDGLSWRPTIKLSEQIVKISNPGVQQVKRYQIGGKLVGDVIYNPENPVKHGSKVVDSTNPLVIRDIKTLTEGEDLLVPIFRGTKNVYNAPSTGEIRDNVKKNLMYLGDNILRFKNPHGYFVGLEQSLFDKKVELINAIKDN